MEKMLIIGTDGSVVPRALEYCKKRGIHTIITDFTPVEKRPMKLLSDSYWMLDVKDIDALEKRCIAEGVTGIFAGCNEFFMDCARMLAKRLGLPYLASDEAWLLGRDKRRFKQACMECGLDVPREYVLSADAYTEEELNAIKFPVIVKPVDGNAAIGVYKCGDRSELIRNIELAKKASMKSSVLVEEFIEGTLMNIHVYSDGKTVAAPTVFPLILRNRDGNALLMGGFYSQRINDLFMKTTESALQSFIERIRPLPGAFFLQAIWKDGRFYFIELNARVDGVANVTVAGDFDFVGAQVEIVMGHPAPAVGELRLARQRSEGISGTVLFFYCRQGVVKEVVGLDEVKRIPGIDVIFARAVPGTVFGNVTNMLQIGYYIVIWYASNDELVEKVQTINKTLHVIGEQGEEMLLPNNDYGMILDDVKC